MSSAKEIRICANDEGLTQVFYKFDASQPGWYPKPFEKKDVNSWNRVFGHSDAAQGNVMAVIEAPSFERGFRQHWSYKVVHAGGDVVDVLLKCISIPVSLDYGEISLLEHIHSGTHQKFNGDLINSEYKDKLIGRISSILRNRDCEADIPQWEEFINNFPNSSEFDLGTSYVNVFYQLAIVHGGAVQVVPMYKFLFMSATIILTIFYYIYYPLDSNLIC